MDMKRAFASYQAANLRAMAPLSLLATVVIYIAAVASDKHVLPMFVVLAPMLPMLLLIVVIRHTRATRTITLLALASVVFVEVAINVVGIGLVNGLTWVMPGSLLLPVVTSVFWPSRRVFLIAMTLSALGPAPMILVRGDGGLQLLQLVVYMAGAITLATMMYAVMERTVRRQLQLERQLREQASVDGLTGVLLRNHFLERAQQALDACLAQGRPVCVAYLDTDRFKSLNDTHGHAAGDAVLIGLARCLREHARTDDLVGRVGGEEFTVLLPGMDLPMTHARVEAIRQAARSVQRPDGPLTLSIGIARSQAGGESIHALLGRAESAMRQAKTAGRDRIVLDEADAARGTSHHDDRARVPR